MKHLIYTFIALLFLSACGSDQTDAENALGIIAPNQLLTIEVEGLDNEREIKKQLSQLNGVDKVDVDFNAERTKDFIKVYFNNDFIPEAKLIKTIESIHNKQYCVLSSSLSAYCERKDACNSNKHSSEENSISASSGSFEVPNILDLLSSIIVG